MAKKLKITKQELEQDEVALTVQTLAEKASRNRSRLMVIGGAILLIVAVGYGYSSYRRQTIEESSQTLNLANQIFSQLPSMQSEEERTKGLTNLINSLQNLIDQRPGSPAAHAALYLKGNCHYYMDDFDRAQTAFTDYANNATDDEDRARGVLAVASTQENKFYFNGNQVSLLDEAMASYEKAEQLAPAGSYLQFSALLAKARILELRYKDTEAMEIYRRIIKERPSPVKVAAEEAEDTATFDLGKMLQNQISRSLAPLSLEAAAKVRLETLEGSSQNVKRAQGKSSVESADDGTTPTASAPAMPVASPAAPIAEPTAAAPPADAAAPPADAAAPALPQIVPQNP